MGKSKDVKTGSKASKAEVNTLLHRVKSGKITKPHNQAKPATKVATKEVAPSKKEKKSKKAPTPSESSESESESEESSSSSSESEEEAKPVKAAAKKEVTTSSESSDSSISSNKDAASSGSDSDSDKSDSSSESGSDSSDSSESEEETVPAKAVKAAKAVVNGAAKVVAKATVRLHCDETCKNYMLTFSQESGSDSDSDSDSSESEAEEKAEKKSESGSDSDSSDEEESTEESSEEAAPSKKRKADDDEEEVSAKKTKSDAVEDTGSKNLFVGNLSWNIDDEWLYREFEEFGEITGARVISDRDSGRSKGFGYVEFANSADAAKALAAKKGALIDGREANVDFSTPRDNAAPKDRANARAATYGDQKNPESDTLFVGNISFEANEDIIGEAFGAHGTVVNVRLPTDM